MKDKMMIICPGETSPLLEDMMNNPIPKDPKNLWVRKSSHLRPIQNRRFLMAVSIDSSGINLELMAMLRTIAKGGPDYFSGSMAAVYVVGEDELFTKSIARKIIFYLNRAGASFVGRPVVETTGSMKNLAHVALSRQLSLRDTCLTLSEELLHRTLTDHPPKKENPRLLVLYSSNWNTSNTLMLWSKIKARLQHIQIQEIHIENGSVRDCIGCPYKTCRHYGQQKRCYYGGIMITDVYPAILSCDALLLLCPNYNDAISANLSAVINRLTALFRKTQFYDKYLFSLIVSGHSGSDLLAEQLISALAINKTFRLPAHFSMMETANDPGEVLTIPGIGQRIDLFAQQIERTLL